MPAEPPHQQGDECREEPNSLYSLLAPLVVETDKEVQNVAATQAELDKAVAHLTQRITFSLVADSSANSLVQPTLLIVELAEFSKCVPPNSLDVYLKKVAASKDILRRVASVLDNVESRIAFMNNRYVQYDAAHAPPYAEKLKNVIQELGNFDVPNSPSSLLTNETSPTPKPTTEKDDNEANKSGKGANQAGTAINN